MLQPSGADRLLHAPHVCSGCQIEEMVDELDLSRQIISCHPSNLPLPDHVDCFVALNGSPGRLEFSESLFGVHSTFDGSMILFEEVIQVLARVGVDNDGAVFLPSYCRESRSSRSAAGRC